MLPAIVGLLVALAVLLMLLAALRTSKGRKLLSKLRERAKKQKDDGPMTTGANVRENDTQPGMPSSEELADLDLSTSFFDSLMVKLRILISMIQVLSQLGVVYSIPFPSLYSNLLRWIGLLELNFIDILPLGCVMSVGFHFSLLMRTLVLPALLLVALAAKVVRAPKSMRKFFNGLNFLVLFLIFPSTSAAIFATFQCEELSDGTRWLRADLSVDCDGDSHTLFRYYAGLMVIVYPLGTPLFYLFLLWRNRARLNKLRVNQALRIQLINNVRASGDYKSGRTSEDKRQVPWIISEEERSGLSIDVLKDLRELEHEDFAERAALPSSVSKLLKGYELRVCWFEIFECVRKLAVACLPVFFQPSGSASQLLFGLMVCFLAFGAYVHFDPFEDRGNDAVARLCQVQIFFSLLSSVALSFGEDENAGSYIDVLLVMLWFLPVTLAVVLESQPVVSELLSWLVTQRMTTVPVGSVTTEDTSTDGVGQIQRARSQAIQRARGHTKQRARSHTKQRARSNTQLTLQPVAKGVAGSSSSHTAADTVEDDDDTEGGSEGGAEEGAKDGGDEGGRHGGRESESSSSGPFPLPEVVMGLRGGAPQAALTPCAAPLVALLGALPPPSRREANRASLNSAIHEQQCNILESNDSISSISSIYL